MHVNGVQNTHEDVFDDLNHVESRFFAEGYAAGHAHGKLHGTFEGREIGREKAFELWEEVGYYEGWAGFWIEVLQRKGVMDGGRGKESRALGHAKQLSSLIATFPVTNPTPIPDAPIPSSLQDSSLPSTHRPSSKPSTKSPPSTTITDSSSSAPDLPTLLSSIRARYRLLCSSLNVRPRLSATKDGQDTTGRAGETGVELPGQDEGEGVVEGTEGPMKGVDARQLRF